MKSYNIALDTIIYNDLTNHAQLPFRHVRFQYIDHKFLKDPSKFVWFKSDNAEYYPAEKFLSSLTSIHFSNCFLCWSTIKRILVKTRIVGTLKISNCHIIDYEDDTATTSTSRHRVAEGDEFRAGNAIFFMKEIEIYETATLDNITFILKKLGVYLNQSLTSLKITYYPPEGREGRDDDTRGACFDLCRSLKTLLSLSVNSLQTLCLNMQHEPTLSLLGFHICKELEALGSRMSLTEFQMSTSLGCWICKPNLAPKASIAINGGPWVESDKAGRSLKAVATSLARFLESQTRLKTLVLPCIEHPEAFSSCFEHVLSQLPCASDLQYLAVPSAGFLPPRLMHIFPELKSVKVGGECCRDYTSGWEIFKAYTPDEILDSLEKAEEEESAIVRNEFQIVSRQPKSLLEIILKNDDDFKMLKRIEELCIATTIIPSNFRIIVRSLSNLTFLDISSGPNVPIVKDDDLQACIKHLKRLQSLLIGCSSQLTDYGITGIPLETCGHMFKNQRYHLPKRGINKKIWTSPKVTGRPLSDLKGLRKLALMGNSAFTDIGIGYGLNFKELKYLHLPYSDYITSWGIERLGKVNPSLETVGISGVSQLNKNAFLELRRSHARIRKGDASRSGYFTEEISPVVEDFSLVLMSTDAVWNALTFVANKIIQPLIRMISPLQGVDETENESL